MDDSRTQDGFALIGALLLLALLMSLLVGYSALTRIELSTTDSTMRSFRGFYAAEAGLNVRADLVRQTFDGYNRPTGATPSSAGSNVPCVASNVGSGDFRCIDYEFEKRDVTTYVEERGTPAAIVIPRGEPFQNLNAQEYRYVVYSTAHGMHDTPEALLEMHFKSRLVPMFQFMAFYDKDLEVLPLPSMTLAGPLHANGDIYLGTTNTLDVLGQITASGELYRGYKSGDTCLAGPVKVADPDNLVALPACSGSRRLYTEAELAAWNDQILVHLDNLVVPQPSMLEPDPSKPYFQRADLRVVLDLDASPPAITVREADGDVDVARSAVLAACGATGYSNTFYNNREATSVRMLEVDVRGLLDCVQAHTLMDSSRPLNDTTDGGLVWYLGVVGADAGSVNDYGVRVRNGAELASTIVGAPAIKGLTIVTDQALYVRGDYNATEKKPAAFLADSLNVLSGNWNDANDTLPVASRPATATTIQAAFLAGTDTTGGAEGSAGQDLAQYNGGLENFPRLHEDWTGRALNYVGSFVTLGRPLHVDGSWTYGGSQYLAPVRNWAFDDDFNDAALLPPLTPRFVYLRQELFVRQFEL